MLVSNEPPIIGYNVIEHLVKYGMEHHPGVTSIAVREAFSFNCKKAAALIHLVKTAHQNNKEAMVKVGCLKTVIPAGQTKEVKCSLRTGPLAKKNKTTV